MTNPTAAGTADPAQPGKWVADLAASTVSFTVRNFGLRSVTGQVPLVGASVTVVWGDRSGHLGQASARLDPLRSTGGTVALEGFFGWPLTTVAS